MTKLLHLYRAARYSRPYQCLSGARQYCDSAKESSSETDLRMEKLWGKIVEYEQARIDMITDLAESAGCKSKIPELVDKFSTKMIDFSKRGGPWSKETEEMLEDVLEIQRRDAIFTIKALTLTIIESDRR